ncbi:MAG: ankyrin repeat domain-containing protein [Parachlamydiaceae bacterium]
MANNSYFNIALNSQTFSIVESSTKLKKCHNAIFTLEKIEKALKEDLKYSALPAGHSPHQMTRDESFRLLQAKATEIHDRYVRKQSKLCWLWRKTFSKEKQVDAIYKRIINLTPRTENALPILHDDAIYEVFKFLPIDVLLNFAQVNKHANAHADLALKDIARKFGYKGQNNIRAKKYLKNLYIELQHSLKQALEYDINNHIVRNDQGKIAIEESLNGLRQLPIDDLAKLFASDIPLKRLKKAIVTPPISPEEPFNDQRSANLALYIAVRNREFEVVRFLLAHGANANLSFFDISHLVSTEVHESLLSLSIKQKTPRMTQLLLHAKASIGSDLLHEAARMPHNQKNIKLLLEYGANIDQLDDENHSAIFIAIKKGNLANVKAFIKGGIDLNHQNDFGESPLHLAIKDGTPEMIRLLIQHGADPYKRSKIGGDSPFVATIKNKNVAQVQAFTEGGVDLNYAKEEYDPLALCIAIDEGTPEILKLLLQHGADPHKSSIGISPFLSVIKKHDLEKALAFIEGGVDINRIYDVYGTPLHYALVYGTPEIIKLLLQHGADPHLCDEWGNSPFILAIRRKNLQNVLTFIEGGVDLNYPYSHINNRTALHVAAQYAIPSEIIKLLLHHGANPYQCDKWGNSPFVLAIRNKNLKGVLAFIEEEVDLNYRFSRINNQTALHVAAEYATPEIIKLLLQYGADPYQCDNRQNTPLVTSIMNLSLKNVLAFIEGGFNLNYIDPFGKTALFAAAKYGNFEIAHLLLQHGADPRHRGALALLKQRFGFSFDSSDESSRIG